MSKVVFIGSDKILRQAVSLTLFPDHEVEVWDEAKGLTSEALKDCDLLVFDAAALQQTGRSPQEIQRAVQNSNKPTIWLEEDETGQPPKKDKLVALKKPLEKETFQRAVMDLLSHGTDGREQKSATAASRPKAAAADQSSVKKQPGEVNQPSPELIELVDVVEEDPAQKRAKKSLKKSK